MRSTGTGGKMVAPPDETTADPYAVIAALRAERDAALQERAALAQALVTREAEKTALLARQSASAEVLKAISTSPDDTQPVFDLIARRARELCGAAHASVTQYDGSLLHLRARDGYDAATASLGDQDWPRPPGPETMHGRAVLKREAVQVRDVLADQVYAMSDLQAMRRLGSRSLLGVPLLRGGAAIGVISLGRSEPGGFTPQQIDVVQSFAEQAVIAITSAETYRALQTRTTDLQQSLEYQAATSDVLKVISRSTFFCSRCCPW
jgi:GAF domain-containing protein